VHPAGVTAGSTCPREPRTQTAELKVGWDGRLSGLSSNRPIAPVTAGEYRGMPPSGVCRCCVGWASVVGAAGD